MDYSANKKYQSIIATGKTLFWKYGLKRVSIEEICKEAPVSKMTFYKFFPNKLELAKKIIEDLMMDAQQQFKTILELDAPFEIKVEQMMKMKMEGTVDLSAEFLNDIYKHPENGLLASMEKLSTQSHHAFVTFLEDAQQRGDIRNDVKIDYIVYQLNVLSQSVNDEQLQAHYNTPNDLIMEGMRFFFYGIMPNSCKQ